MVQNTSSTSVHNGPNQTNTGNTTNVSANSASTPKQEISNGNRTTTRVTGDIATWSSIPRSLAGNLALPSSSSIKLTSIPKGSTNSSIGPAAVDINHQAQTITRSGSAPLSGSQSLSANSSALSPGTAIGNQFSYGYRYPYQQQPLSL